MAAWFAKLLSIRRRGNAGLHVAFGGVEKARNTRATDRRWHHHHKRFDKVGPALDYSHQHAGLSTRYTALFLLVLGSGVVVQQQIAIFWKRFRTTLIQP